MRFWDESGGVQSVVDTEVAFSHHQSSTVKAWKTYLFDSQGICIWGSLVTLSFLGFLCTCCLEMTSTLFIPVKLGNSGKAELERVVFPRLRMRQKLS